MAQHYEPKLRFDPTPVYSVTLAEDVTIDLSTDYSIDLGGEYDAVIVSFVSPANVDRNGTIYFDFTDSTSLAGPFRGQNGANGIVWTERIGNVVSTFGSWGNIYGSNAWYNFGNGIVITDAKMDTVRFVGNTLGTTIPAGTTITIYGAQEV